MDNLLRARTEHLIPQLVQLGVKIKIGAYRAFKWLFETIITIESSEDIGLMELHQAVKWHIAWNSLVIKERAPILSPVANKLFAADQRVVEASVRFIKHFNK